MDDLDKWLDAPDETPFPGLKTPDEIDEFLDAPDVPEKKLKGDDIDAFLDAKPDELGSVELGFRAAVQQQMPEDLAYAVEGVSVLSGIGQPEGDYEGTKIPQQLRDIARSGVQYERKIPDYTKITNVDDALTYVGESFGSMVGSTLPSIITGGAGAYVGRRAGKMGATLGAIGGAAVPSIAQNFGQLYGALIEEGVPKEKAAEWAMAATGPIVALDVTAPTSWLMRLTGDAKREAIRTLGKRIASEALKGMAIEGSTEAAQQGIQAGTVAAAADKPLFTAENAVQITDAFLQGSIGGGGMGAVQGVVPDKPTAAAPPPRTAPAPAFGATDPTAAPATVTPGATVGLSTPAGAVRVAVEAVEDGNVFYTTPEGVTFGMPVEDFSTSIVPAPEPADAIRGDATTVPPAPSRPDPMDYGDIADFDPDQAPEPRTPPPPSPQQAMNLPDTRAIDRAAAAAREFRKAAIEATDAERRSYLNSQADALDNEALDLRRQLAARSDQGGQGVPAADVRARASLGRLGEAAPAASEATTGPVSVDTRRPQTPLERAAPTVSEAVTGPVPQRVTPAPDTRTELERAAPAVQPAAPVTPIERPKPTVEQLVRARTAKLNDPASIARKTGQSVEEVRAELQRIAGVPNSPISQVRGKVKIDPKTKQPIQSARAGMLTYKPQRTKPMTLLEALSAAGGVQDPGGDLASMGADTWHRGKPGKKSLVNERGIAWNELGDWAEQEGYLPKRPVDETTGENYHRDQADVVAMIQKELGGQKQFALDEIQEPEAAPEPSPQERREYEVRRDLERLQEPVDPMAELADLEAQLDERLGMMKAATVDEAVDMLNAEMDALDRIMEESYDGWNADIEPGTAEAAAVSETAGRQEDVAGREGTGPTRDEDRGTAGRGAAAEVGEGVGEGKSLYRRADRPEVQQSDEGQVLRDAGQDGPGRRDDQDGAQPRDGDAEGVILKSENDPAAAELQFYSLTSDFQNFANAFDDKITAAAEWTLRKLRQSGWEHVVVLDESGNVVDAGTSRSRNGVAVGERASKVMKEQGRRVQVIHSHPEDFPLSQTDLTILANPGVSTIAAVGNGTLSTIARLGPNGPVPDGSQNSKRAILDIANAAWEAAKNSVIASGLLGTVGVEKASAVAGLAMSDGMARAGVIQFAASEDVNPILMSTYNKAVAAAERAANEESNRYDRSAKLDDTPGGSAPVLDRAGKPRDSSGDRQEAEVSKNEGAREEAGGASDTGPVLAQNSTRENRSAVRQILDRFRRNPGTASENARNVVRATREAKGPPQLRKLSSIGNLISFAATVASKDTISAKYYTAEKAMARYAEALTREGARDTSQYYSDAVGDAGRAKINKILEHDRLMGIDRKDTGNRVVARMPTTYRGTLAKPGDIVTLNAVESRALAQMREFFDKRWMQFGKAMARQFGWDGPFNEAALNKAVRDATGARQRDRASRALEIYRMIDQMRRSGYVPFARYGDTKISIRPKPKYEPGKDGLQYGKPVHVELVPTRQISDTFISEKVNPKEDRAAVMKRRQQLEKDFPRDQYDYEVTPLNTIEDVRKIDLPAIEKLFMIMNAKNPEMGTKVYDDILKELFDQRKAGFRRQSNNVPGYSNDFERSVADYIHQTSNVISRMELGREVNEAFEATQKHQDRDIAKFWKDYRDYIESPGDDFAALRKIAFWSFIWGSLSSAAINLTQTPLVTLPQTASWAGPRAVTAVGDSITEAMEAITVNKDGMTLNWDKIGKTPEEKRMIAQLRDEGVLDPVIARDLQGFDKGTTPSNRKWRRRFDRAYEIGASAFNAAEMANRVGAALANFRLAQRPGALDKARKVYAEDAEFRQMVGRNGTPLDMARFMVDETQFIGGKRGRPRVLRGPGSVLLQWKQYQANWIRLMYKNMTRMGPEGKMAGAAMLIGLVATAGLMGVPFAEDLLDLANWLTKLVTKVDPSLERRIAKWLRDAGMGEVGAEIAMHGPSREFLGIDLGSRIGMGEMAPDLGVENAFPLLGATIGRAAEAWQRYGSGQTIGAAAALLPKGVADVVKATMALPEEGYRTKAGDITLFPNEITAAQQIARFFGFQPGTFTRQSEYIYAQRQFAAATQEASTNLLANVAAELALAVQAQKYGDEDAYAFHAERYARLLRENAEQLMDDDLPGWLKIPQPAVRAIKMRLRQIMDFDAGLLQRTGKTKREEMMDYPLPRE